MQNFYLMGFSLNLAVSAVNNHCMLCFSNHSLHARCMVSCNVCWNDVCSNWRLSLFKSVLTIPRLQTAVRAVQRVLCTTCMMVRTLKLRTACQAS